MLKLNEEYRSMPVSVIIKLDSYGLTISKQKLCVCVCVKIKPNA